MILDIVIIKIVVENILIITIICIVVLKFNFLENKMFKLIDKVNLVKGLGLVTVQQNVMLPNGFVIKELLTPVDGVTIYVAGNSHNIMPATKIDFIYRKNGGYYFSIGNKESYYKLKSDNFVIKHDDDFINLEMGLFARSAICQQNNPYHSLAV
jgi:hypothetical protein